VLTCYKKQGICPLVQFCLPSLESLSHTNVTHSTLKTYTLPVRRVRAGVPPPFHTHPKKNTSHHDSHLEPPVTPCGPPLSGGRAETPLLALVQVWVIQAWGRPG
jgi:hypothetical protein